MNINRNSWHYKIAAFGDDDLKHARQIDLCAFARKMLKGVFLRCCLLVIAMLIGACLGDFVAWVCAWYTLGYAPMADLGAGLTMMVGFIAFCVVAVEVWQHKRLTERVMPPIVTEAYRGWKEKYCPVFEVK